MVQTDRTVLWATGWASVAAPVKAGAKPSRTPHRTAWVRLETPILRWMVGMEDLRVLALR